ncbi:MAG TPA: alpha/beta fold hydrolase [Rhodothermales bacterium]|nr:alpha/beta fold hydrolase [Rhodothermales bacterium]
MQTIYAGVFRVVRDVQYQRERIETPDGDFLDLDWSRESNDLRRVAVLSHGLEGSSSSPYVLGMTRALNRRGWDVLAWNFRGCSGEMNRLARSYHSGATEDLDLVVHHALEKYEEVALVGFSLGGNLTLKFLGERDVDPRVAAAAVISVPCDLAACSEKLARPENLLYMQRFLSSLRIKVRAKARIHRLDTTDIHRIRTFRQFDDRFTALLHGFLDAEDYWRRCSCKAFLSHVRTPTLLVSAEDDPFLAASCYPLEEANANPNLRLLVTKHGGHVGFVDRGRETWPERIAAGFFDEHAPAVRTIPRSRKSRERRAD